MPGRLQQGGGRYFPGIIREGTIEITDDTEGHAVVMQKAEPWVGKDVFENRNIHKVAGNRKLPLRKFREPLVRS